MFTLVINLKIFYEEVIKIQAGNNTRSVQEHTCLGY